MLASSSWVLLGAADESKPAADGTVEAWGRSPGNPVGGWYGLRKGYRGRFGMYLPVSAGSNVPLCAPLAYAHHDR